MIAGPRPANAYNWNTHKRTAQVAAAIVRDTGPRPAQPAGANPVLWSVYLDFVRGAGNRLLNLQVGLDSNPNIRNRSCPRDPRDNLANLAAFRIRDFNYKPLRSEVPCGLTPIVNPDPEQVLTLALGLTLGWHGASVDDLTHDTKLWIRPTSALYIGYVREAASSVIQLGLGAILTPFICLGGLGGWCESALSVGPVVSRRRLRRFAAVGGRRPRIWPRGRTAQFLGAPGAKTALWAWR